MSLPPPARLKLTFAYDYRNRRIAKGVFQLETLNLRRSIDLLGLERFVVIVTSTIRDPDLNPGEKTSHYVQFDENGKIPIHREYIGITVIPYPMVGGGRLTPATITGSHPNFTIRMVGSAYTTPFATFGKVHNALNPISGSYPSPFSDLNIDYDLSIKVDLCMRTGEIRGSHDGYPSYTVRFSRVGIVYDFQQLRIGHLLSPMDISAHKDFTF